MSRASDRGMRGLYAILDMASLGGADPLAFARALLDVPLAALQLRAKDLPAAEVLALLEALRPMCEIAHVPLVCNDHPDLAARAGCDMVHLGQEDASIAEVRRLYPGLGVGLSTHTPEQLARALASRPDYVAFGPVFSTESKKNPSPTVGLAGLRAAALLTVDVPLVAIGGITLARAPDVARIAPAAAIIGALLPSNEDTAARALSIHRALGGLEASS